MYLTVTKTLAKQKSQRRTAKFIHIQVTLHYGGKLKAAVHTHTHTAWQHTYEEKRKEREENTVYKYLKEPAKKSNYVVLGIKENAIAMTIMK